MILNYCFKGLAFQGTLPASFLFTGVDAEVQGAVASNIICGSSSIGGAPDFQSGCCEFESRLPLQIDFGLLIYETEDIAYDCLQQI